MDASLKVVDKKAVLIQKNNMSHSQVLLGLVLQEADIPASVDTFDNRLLVQKGVYLLQDVGVELGYPYSWYVRGPYSSRLATDLFGFAESNSANSEMKGYALGNETRERIGKVKDLLKLSDPSVDGRAKWLELLASTLFLIRTKQAQSTDIPKIVAILQANEKPFESENVAHALERLTYYGYVL